MLKFIRTIDFYGKEPEFYYKDKSSIKTWLGRIFTILYITIYIIFFIYKINRMVKRKDVTFYDTNTNKGEIPSIKLTKDIFYAAFSFDNPETNNPFVDERIYTISGKYMTENIIDGYRNITAENISFKRCELSDFGKNYQNILSNKNLSNMLCPINIDYVLEGYYTMEKYSYIVLNYKRCVNSTENNNHCYPMETIEKYLTITNMDAKIHDIELTPQDYDNPVQHLERDLSGKGFKGFQPSILVEMKIVMIETDDNIVGFEGLTKTRIDKYLKYDSALLTPNPSTNDDSNNIAINLNEIIIRLSPSALYQKRTYVQLVDVLGDVGGLMEFVNMLFGGICYFIVDILYNKSLVNNLFNFDISKKNVILKNKNNSKIIDIDNKNVLSKNNNEKKENFQIKRYKRKINIIKDFYTPQSIKAFNEGNNNHQN